MRAARRPSEPVDRGISWLQEGRAFRRPVSVGGGRLPAAGRETKGIVEAVGDASSSPIEASSGGLPERETRPRTISGSTHGPMPHVGVHLSVAMIIAALAAILWAHLESYFDDPFVATIIVLLLGAVLAPIVLRRED